MLLLLVGHICLPNFLAWRSQRILSRQVWETAIVAVGMTMIIIAGGIDLSVGSAMALAAVAFGVCYQATQSIVWSATACLAMGSLGGALNGALIAALSVHPLVITLASYAAYRGIAEGISQGASYSQFGQGFQWLGRGQWMGLPSGGWLYLALAAGGTICLWRTAIGRCVYAMGHNQQATRFAGVRIHRITLGLYTFSGMLAGVAALFYISRFDSASAHAGLGLELDAITAVVIGGTSIYGGRGNLIGTTLGLALVHETKLFVGRYWQIEELKSIVVGMLLIGSILCYRAVARRQSNEPL